MNRFRFLLLLCFTLQSTYCIRIIYREASSPGDSWFENADWFNLSLPRCSSDTTEGIQTQCAKYGAEKCASNLPCSCTCPTSNATLAFYGDKWRCTGYAEINNRVRCRYKFNRENNFNHTVYLPTTNANEKAVIDITGTSGSCTINMSSSKYLRCNATWSPITVVNGTTNATFYLNHYFGDFYSLKVNYNEASSLRGKLIKLGFNCNSTGGGGESCVMFKLRGQTDCGENISGESSCQVNTSPVSQYSPETWRRTTIESTSSVTSTVSFTRSLAFHTSSIGVLYSTSDRIKGGENVLGESSCQVNTSPVGQHSPETWSRTTVKLTSSESSFVLYTRSLSVDRSSIGVLYSTSDTIKGPDSTTKPTISYTASLLRPKYLTSSSTNNLSETLVNCKSQQKVSGGNNLPLIATVTFFAGMLFGIFVALIIVAVCRRKRCGFQSGKVKSTKHKPRGDASIQSNLESNYDLPYNITDRQSGVSLNHHGRTSERDQFAVNNLPTSTTNSLYQELVARQKKGTQMYQLLAFKDKANMNISSEYENVKKHIKHHQARVPLSPSGSSVSGTQNHSYINVVASPLGIKRFGASSAVSGDSSFSFN